MAYLLNISIRLYPVLDLYQLHYHIHIRFTTLNSVKIGKNYEYNFVMKKFYVIVKKYFKNISFVIKFGETNIFSLLILFSRTRH